jgi:hypothetical protein
MLRPPPRSCQSLVARRPVLPKPWVSVQSRSALGGTARWAWWLSSQPAKLEEFFPFGDLKWSEMDLARTASSGKTWFAAVLLVVGLLLVARLVWSVSRRPGPFDDPPGPHAAEPNTLHVLFVGNSFTSVNDLPTMIGELAKAAGERRSLRVGRCLHDGFSLSQHWDSGEVARVLAEGKWDVVVLQEQSAIPSWDPQRRARLMDMAVAQFHEAIAHTKAKPVFYLTWGYREGDRKTNVVDTYIQMQSRLEQGYREVAREIDAPIVPVGIAWSIAHERDPRLPLWQRDGRHPSRLGTYLAACTFYGWLYDKSPVGNPFTGKLSRTLALSLQRDATRALESRGP